MTSELDALVTPDGVYTPGELAASVADTLADAPAVYVLVNGTWCDGTVSGSLMLDTGELLWTEERADDVDALKVALTFDSGPRLAHLIGLYPDGFRIEVVEGDLPDWLAEANRAFVIASGRLDESDDPWGDGVRRVWCPNATEDPTSDPTCPDACPLCEGAGWLDSTVER